MKREPDRIPERRVDVDWLRVLATYLLFVFHGAMVFNPAPFYHVRNADLSTAVMILCGFISLWHMPLFFVLAGWSMASSLRFRGVTEFARERVSRLLVPLVAGCILLAPLIKYLELSSGLDLNHARFAVSAELQEGFRQVIPAGLPVAPAFGEGFFEFLPTFFTRIDRFTWSHLWFVAYLLTFSALYLPLLGWWARRPARERPFGAAAVYAPLLPLAAIQVFLRPLWPGIYNLYADWANFAWYSTFLFLGFALARQPGFEAAVHREEKRALAIGLVSLGLLLPLALGVIVAPELLLALTAVAAWCFIVFFLAAAHRLARRTGPVLAYLSESAFPVYVLHQSAIVVIGYALVRLPLGIAPKLVLLIVASTSATLAFYEFVVRRSGAARFLLGMKPRIHGEVDAAHPGRRAAAALVLVIFSARPDASAWAATPAGIWWAEGGAARVEIAPCGETFCGRVVWLNSPLDENGCELRDRNNPEPAMRGRTLVGLEILRDLSPGDADGRWDDGEIYDPTSGRTYRCTATLDGPNRLRLRGYVGIPLLGRTTTWIRMGAEERLCRESAG